MRTIGVIAVIFLGGVLLLGVVAGVTSIPDVKRYLRIRSM